MHGTDSRGLRCDANRRSAQPTLALRPSYSPRSFADFCRLHSTLRSSCHSMESIVVVLDGLVAVITCTTCLIVRCV